MYTVGVYVHVCIKLVCLYQITYYVGNNIILDQFLNSHPLVMVPDTIALMVATTSSFITVCSLVIFYLPKLCHRFPSLAGELRSSLHLWHSVL